MRQFLPALALALIASIQVSAQSASESLHQLFDETWTAELESWPIFATSIGVHTYNDRLPDVSPEAHVARATAYRDAMSRLEAIDRSALDDDDKLNYDLYRHRLEERLGSVAFKGWRMPFSNDSGFHTELVHMVEGTPFETVDDYEAYLTRLSAIPAYLDQQISNMRQGLTDGFSQPSAILANVEPTFAAIAYEPPEEASFYKPFTEINESISQAAADDLRGRGLAIVKGEVLPAFEKLHRFFETEYMPGARQSLGASDMPDGSAYYERQISYYTTLDLSASEIHDLGLAEADRIRGRMQAILEEVEFDGTLQEFFEFLRTDPQFYAKTDKELLMTAAWISKRIDEKMPAYFGLLPRMPYGVRAVPPEIAPNYTTGRYWSSIPGKRGGLYMVNTYGLERRPLYNLPALTLHEGVPGHHHQISISYELEDLPEFRKYTYINAFGEGWGLYSEYLGEEMGIYETPYERFGRLTYEMWRAGRLVVDTGIHSMGWTRDAAVDFFLQNSALSEHNINTEVDRYISWPGQALGYKMGELKILELRQNAEQTLGERFDVRDFHDAVLENGALPLPVLEEQIDAYIATKLEVEQPRH
jgi:uncharacterized protein (DUF885 family)